LIDKIFPRNRLFSGVIAGAFGLLIVSLGGWWFTFAVGLIVHIGLLEYFRMAKSIGIRPATKTTLVACHIMLITTQYGVNGILPEELTSAVLPLSGAAICGWLILQPITGSIADISSSIFGLFYLGFLPSHWIRLRNIDDMTFINNSEFLSSINSDFINPGMIITLFTCLMIVSTDIGSYYFGKKYGKNSLSTISPKKTIEGAVFGLISSMIIGSIFGNLMQWKFGILVGLFLGFLVALFSLVGDLTESMMKRNAGVKDSGEIIPGHGGILDRIDSYLFTPAVIYYILSLLMPLIN
tara:strand:+ start:3773 stop:4660 length:888 start_codon:yes stop_codon:yes gene_type:complete